MYGNRRNPTAQPTAAQRKHTTILLRSNPVHTNPVRNPVGKGRHKILRDSQVRTTWATPRCRISQASNNLTYRGCSELANQIRFATCTPPEQRVHTSPSTEWVEWLVGLPCGYTDCTRTDIGEHNNWIKEPCPRADGRRHRHRWRMVGNICVPQQCAEAFKRLITIYTPHSDSICLTAEFASTNATPRAAANATHTYTTDVSNNGHTSASATDAKCAGQNGPHS